MVFRAAFGSTVHITTLAMSRDLFTMDVTQVPRGTGSGIVWDDRGHVVTNFHVIQGASAARVTLADQTQWQAELVGAFPERDLAVLRIGAPRDKLKPLAIGSSRDLQVGQKVYAIGNPFGLDQTLTTGIISALNREIGAVNERKIRGVIQTDAAINPGNSGGPLLDSAGRLIGVNTAIFSPSGASAGIGFAIPVDEVNRVVPRLIRDGHLYLAMPPLYRLAQGGTVHYARDDAHKDELMKSAFKGKGKVEISRFKGLGEMPPAQLKETTMDPAKRILLRVGERCLLDEHRRERRPSRHPRVGPHDHHMSRRVGNAH